MFRTPKVQRRIQGIFNSEEPCEAINPDEAVADASVQATIAMNALGKCKHVVARRDSFNGT